MKRRSASKTILVASLASMFAAIPASLAAEGSKETAPCYGVNKCKGMGDCSGKGHACAGHNACKRQGYIEMDKKTCLRLDGGRLTAEKGEDAKTEDMKKEKKKMK